MSWWVSFDERDPDYWAATPGNAGAALADLLKLAELMPTSAVVRVWA